MALTFELTKNEKGEFYFKLLASAGGTLLRSEGYNAKASANNGIESIRKNAGEDGRYEFFPGYFRPREEEPPPVYREPGHVQLHVPAPDVRPSTQLPDRIVVRPGVELPRTTGPGASPDVGTHPVDTTPTLPGGTDLTTPPDTTPPETTPSTQQPPAMECALAITRAPRRNARFTVNGQGFDDTVVVQVAGTVQVVRAVTPTSLEAQTDRAGEVVLVRGEERVSCGRLELF